MHACLRIALIAGLMLGGTGFALAKRLPPPQVKPVVHQGLRYEAPNTDGRRAVVRAVDVATGKARWEVVIFELRIDPKLEADVQHVYIKTLALDGGAVRIAAENGRVYLLDLGTRQVRPVAKP